MALPRVAFVTHPDRPSGVDHWRAFLPARAIEREGFDARCVPLGRDLPAWGKAPPDVVVFNQRAAARSGAFVHLRETLCRRHGMLMVYDCCDDPEPEQGSPLWQRSAVTNDRGETVGALVLDAIRAADLVTVNSQAMAAIIRSYNPHVEVFPDLAEAGDWLVDPPERDGRVTVGVCGGDTHLEDWKPLAIAWQTIARRYPSVQFVATGFCPPYLAEAVGNNLQLEVRPFEDVDRYQWGYQGIDIACAPLADTKWNKSKSPIKWLEHTLAGSAFIGSPVVYGRVVKHDHTGLLARDPAEWVAAIESLLDLKARQRLVMKAAQSVLMDWCWDRDHVLRRLRAYQSHHRRVYGSRSRVA
jgi:hypothetical protein